MKQITVMAEQRDGLVAEITEALAVADVNIETMSGENYGSNAVVIMTVDKYDEALQAIQKLKNMRVVSEDTIILRLDDAPGALAKVARRFADNGIDIRSIRFIEREDGYALVAVSTERSKEALTLVADILVA